MVPTGTLSPGTGIVCNPADHDRDFDPARIRNAGRLMALFGYLDALPSVHAIGYVFPSNAHLAKRCGVSVRTVERWIARLAEIGAIALDFVEGIERRVRILMPARRLRELLLRGVGAKAGRPDGPEAGHPKGGTGSAKARVARSVGGGSVGSVVRGLPMETVQTEDDNVGVVVEDPPEPDPGVLKRAEAAARAYAQRHQVRSWPALLRVAIRDRWEPPTTGAPTPKVGPHRVVTAPGDYALRSKEAREGTCAPQFGAMDTQTGRGAFLAAVKALRGRA